MRIVLLSCFILSFSLLSKAQSLQDHLKSFKPIKNWSYHLTQDTILNTTFNKSQIGYLFFENGDRSIVFMIFNASEFKDSLTKSIVNQYIIEPYCQAFTPEVFGISLFKINDFLFIPMNCPNCDFKKDKSCKKIAKNILDWHYQINKPKIQTKECCKF